MGRGLGQGGADGSQFEDCGSVVCRWGGEEFLARAGAGDGQDGGGLGLFM